MFEELDQSKIKPIHIKSVIVSGMGVFSDSYNLYAISLVFYPIIALLGMSPFQASWVTASSFIGAAVGAILFGAIADKIGRKPMYGIDLLLIFIGAISQLFVSNFALLFTARLVLGFGIGGDYVMSPVIMAENSNARDRGKLMSMSFSMMFLFGAVLAALVDQISYLVLSPDVAWRVILAFGAVPSLFVIYYRRKIPETSRFLARVRGESSEQIGPDGGKSTIQAIKDNVTYLRRLGRSLPLILAGALLWVLYDTYSSTFTIYGPITIAANLGLTPVGFTYAAVFLAGIPGTLVSMYLIDRVGRRKLVIWGYAGVSVALVLFALIQISPGIFGLPPGSISGGNLVGEAATLGFTFYLFNYLFSAAGPATVIGGTIIVPELVPTKARASGQAINVFIDKLAAGTVIAAFPHLLKALGLGIVVIIYAMIALLSSIVVMTLPEAKGKSLEEASQEYSDGTRAEPHKAH